MNLSELNPDIALKSLLDGKVKVGSDARVLEVYAQGMQPNSGVGTDFITILYNGTVSSWTKPIGQFDGNLALMITCKMNSNGTIKQPYMSKIVAQCVELVNRKRSQGFFFSLDKDNVITPPTPNYTTGYATTALNVAWHTTNDY